MDQIADKAGRPVSTDPDEFRMLFQGKWRLPILQQIATGPKRLSELRRSIPQATKKMLVDTLHGLERLGWIERVEYESKIRRVEYRFPLDRAASMSKLLEALPKSES